MKPYVAWIPGLLLIAGLSAAAVTVISLPLRSGLTALRLEAQDLSRREAQTASELSRLDAAKAGSLLLPADLSWTKGSAGSVEVALQQALVSKASSSGLQLVSFAETPPPDVVSSPALASEMELEGTHEQLAIFLESLEEIRPPLAIAYIWLRQLPPDQAAPGSPVSIRMSVWGFREPEALP